VLGGVVGAVVLGVFFGAVWNIRRLGSQWYGPDVLFTGLALGFFVNRRLLDRAACLVWVPGLFWLAWSILGYATDWRPSGMSAVTHIRVQLIPTSYGDFGACAMSECLGIMFVTWPVLNTITYSMGAWLGLMSQANKRVCEDQVMDSRS
jgi:hypothetical protein